MSTDSETTIQKHRNVALKKEQTSQTVILLAFPQSSLFCPQAGKKASETPKMEAGFGRVKAQKGTGLLEVAEDVFPQQQ